jgi:hypothetical protein
MEERVRRSRPALAITWVGFMLAWVAVAILALSATKLGPCGGDGGSPNAAPASPAGRYCDAVDAYLNSGEPGELTTALVYLWPVAALGLVGVYGVWRRRSRLLVAVAVLAFAVLVAHVALAMSLRDRCSPDDRSVPGCYHY